MSLFNKSGGKVLLNIFKSHYTTISPALKIKLLGSTHTNLDDVAIVDHHSAYKYKFLIKQSESLKKKIDALKIVDKNIAVLLPNDVSFVIGMFGIWKSKNAVVPLHIEHPRPLLEYFIGDSEAKLIVTTSHIYEALHDSIKKLKKEVLVIDDLIQPLSDENLSKAKPTVERVSDKLLQKRALIVYTSGTTGMPKGVVLSHLNVAAQVKSVADAWKINSTDTCLHCLPLNHVHGIINALLCPLARGGKVMMEPKFDAYEIWQKLTTIPSLDDHHPTVFMAVPTMYSKLIDMYHSRYDNKPYCREFIRVALSKYVRLLVSGSAPLRTEILREWKEITGHTLLERYGMTEIGMVLTNPLDGDRKPGFVGTPFPGVSVRIAQFDSKRDTQNIICEGDEFQSEAFHDQMGELLVKSDNVFKEYWNRSNETAAEFTRDGWFRTGDTALYQDGSYKIMGRTSVDIIKTGGFKVSALNVENVLISHPSVAEVAVASVYDRTWGEKICAIIVWQGETPFNNIEFMVWAKQRLPHYEVPKVVRIYDGELPKTEMGKVNKKALIKSCFAPIDII